MKAESRTAFFSTLLLFSLISTACKEDDSALLMPPTIYGFGIDINDLALSHIHEDKLFREFGQPITLPDGSVKLLFHPEFYLPMGYKVKAVSEGEVVQIDVLDNEQDLNLMVRPDDAPAWRVAYEHVSNVTVQVGDRISIGQEIAEVSPYSPFSPNLGKTSILIFYGAETRKRGGNVAHCPFLLLHESVEMQLLSDLQNHITNWETENGPIFDQNGWVEVGCAVEQLTEAEAAAH